MIYVCPWCFEDHVHWWFNRSIVDEPTLWILNYNWVCMMWTRLIIPLYLFILWQEQRVVIKKISSSSNKKSMLVIQKWSWISESRDIQIDLKLKNCPINIQLIPSPVTAHNLVKSLPQSFQSSNPSSYNSQVHTMYCLVGCVLHHFHISYVSVFPHLAQNRKYD